MFQVTHGKATVFVKSPNSKGLLHNCTSLSPVGPCCEDDNEGLRTKFLFRRDYGHRLITHKLHPNQVRSQYQSWFSLDLITRICHFPTSCSSACPDKK